MDLLKKIDLIINKIIEVVLSILFILIFLMIFTQVILRYGFNKSIIGTADVFTTLFIYTSALGTAILMRRREHIRIGYFIDKLPLKYKKVVLIVDYLIIALLAFFIFKESVPWIESIKTFRHPITGISRGVESITIPIAFGLIFFYSIYNILLLFFNPNILNVSISDSDLEVEELLAEANESN